MARQRIWAKNWSFYRPKQRFGRFNTRQATTKDPNKAYVLLKHSWRGIPRVGTAAAEPNPGENGFGEDGATASCHFGESRD